MIVEPAKPYRVVLEEQDEDGPNRYTLRELAGGELAPTPEAAVFHLRQIDMELMLRAPTGQKHEGEGAIAWNRFTLSFAREYVVGWENVFTPDGEPVVFKSDYLVDGTISPAITNALVAYLMVKADQKRRSQLGGASSRSTPGSRRISGGPGRARPTAGRAKKTAQKRASARPERPTA